MVRLLLTSAVSWLLLLSAQAGLRDVSCEAMGRIFDFESCKEANFEEYGAVSCMTVAGARYSHAGVNPANFGAYGYGSAESYADELTNQVVFNLAAREVYEANKCQRDFYNELLNPANPETQAFERHVAAAFDAAKPQIRARVPQGNHEAVYRPRAERMRGRVQQAPERMLEIAMRDATDRPLLEIDSLIASIPMGDRIEVRRIAARAAIENWDQARFMAEYRGVLRGFQQNAQASFNQATAGISDRHCGPNDREGICFNVADGARGAADYRQALLDSGVVENMLITSGYANQLDRGYLCRLRRHRRGCVAVTAVEVAGSILMPYAAASLGLRAGLALARVGVGVSRASFFAHAISRGLVFGTYAAEMALASDDVLNTCFGQHPAYQQSKAAPRCSVQGTFYEVRAETAIASCVSSAVLGVGLVGATAIADLAAQGARLEARLAGRLEATAEAADAARAARGVPTSPAPVAAVEEVAQPILVSGAASFRVPLAADVAEAARGSLRSKNITSQSTLTDAQVADLSPAERLVLVSRTAAIDLNRASGDRLMRLVSRPPPSTTAFRDELTSILRSSGVPRSDVGLVVRNIEQRRFLAPSGAPRAPASTTASARLAGAADSAPTAARYLDDAARARIEAELPPRPLSTTEALDLNDQQRIFMVEEMTGLRLTPDEAEAILRVHRQGTVGNYTLADFRARAEAVRTLLRARGIPDAQIPQITRNLIEGFILGQRAQPGIMARFLDRIFPGRRPSAPVVADADLAAAVRANGGENILDPRMTSPLALRARSIRADDLFNPVFRGSVDEMVQAQKFRLERIGNMDGSYWWRSTTIAGERSRSPLASTYSESAGGIDNVRRQVYWPVRHDTSRTGADQFVTSFDNQRVVVNQTRNARGDWVDQSIEVIAREADGTYVPFFYVKQGDRWVMSRTFNGQPIESACIRCHHHPSARTVFTAVPYSAFRATAMPGRAGVHAPRVDLNSPMDVSVELSRIYGGGEAPQAVRADFGAPRVPAAGTATAPSNIGSMGVGDRFRLADSLLPGRGILDGNVALRGAVNRAASQPRAETESILRYGKTREEIATMRAQGQEPTELLPAADVQRLIEGGYTPAP